MDQNRSPISFPTYHHLGTYLFVLEMTIILTVMKFNDGSIENAFMIFYMNSLKMTIRMNGLTHAF